jgi:hypothetical protein
MSQRHILIYILYLPTRLVRSARSAYRHRGLSLLAPRFVEQLNILRINAMLMFMFTTGLKKTWSGVVGLGPPLHV